MEYLSGVGKEPGAAAPKPIDVPAVLVAEAVVFADELVRAQRLEGFVGDLDLTGRCGRQAQGIFVIPRSTDGVTIFEVQQCGSYLTGDR